MLLVRGEVGAGKALRDLVALPCMRCRPNVLSRPSTSPPIRAEVGEHELQMPWAGEGCRPSFGGGAYTGVHMLTNLFRCAGCAASSII